jgi:hypothetical protein
VEHDGAGPTIRGRDNLIDFIWRDCRHGGRDKLPIVVLVGPRGSGKTAILDHLVARCEPQYAQPYTAVIDVEAAPPGERGRLLVAELAYRLSRVRWRQFGHLGFPTFAVGHAVVEQRINTTDPARIEREIIGLLERRVKRTNVPPPGVVDFAALLIQLLSLPQWVLSVGRIAWWLAEPLVTVRLGFKAAKEFYRGALRQPPNSGYSGLVELSRLAARNDPASIAEVDRVLCEAFLHDLAAAYRRGFRPTNCLAFLDNVQAGSGPAFLTALSAAKTSRSGRPTPLTVVATSRRLDVAVHALGGTYLTAWDRCPPDTSVTFGGWLDRHTAHPTSWVYPVRLTDLTVETVWELGQDRRLAAHAPFVWSLSRGHPWTVTQLFDALRTTEPASVLDDGAGGGRQALGQSAADYLLRDLSPYWRQQAVPWAAARDVVTAELCLPETAGLQAQVAPLCWLTGGDGPVLHPFLRRALLHGLARVKPRGQSWPAVYGRLLGPAAGSTADCLSYQVATGDLAPAVAYLNARFDQVRVESWLAELEVITSAPHRTIPVQGAEDRYGDLRDELLAAEPDPLPRRDPHGERWRTMACLTVARWIWSDPLADPSIELNPIIAQSLRDLVRHSPRDGMRLIAEAMTYEGGRRP